MKTITLKFKDSDDLKSFEKYMALAKAQDGTVTGLYCGLMCSALKRSEVVQSAAPELLEALKRIRRTSVKETFHGDTERFQEWLDGFTAEIISKAEGQS